MKSFRVILDDVSTPQDIQKLIGVVEQMRSVKQIDSLNMDPSSGHGQPSPQNYPGQHQAPPNYQNQQPMPPGYPGQQQAPAGYPGQQQAPAGYPGQQQAPAGYPGQQPPPQKPISESSQRSFISSVLKWGVKNNQVDLNRVKTMTPEETIQLAMKLAEGMPDEEKKRLADQIQNSSPQ